MVNLPQPDDSGFHETLAVETHKKGENMLVISLVGLWGSFIIDSVIRASAMISRIIGISIVS